MESLANFSLIGALAFKAPTGCPEQPAEDGVPLPYSLGMRIENLLTKTNEQRQKNIAKLTSRNDPRAEQGETLVFNEEEAPV